jgi:hypothetical protein
VVESPGVHVDGGGGRGGEGAHERAPVLSVAVAAAAFPLLLQQPLWRADERHRCRAHAAPVAAPEQQRRRALWRRAHAPGPAADSGEQVRAPEHRRRREGRPRR